MHTYIHIHTNVHSSENPLTAPLDEFIQHEPDIRKDESTDIKREEFSGVSGTQLQSDMGLRGMLEAWIFDLTGDLICKRDRISMRIQHVIENKKVGTEK